MSPGRRLFACIVCAGLANGCTGKSPTAPALPPAPASPNPAVAIFLSPDTWNLPPGGGSVEITIATAGSLTGNIVAPDVDVTLAASSGTLSDTAPRTDRTGHAKVTWTGTSGATITARAGDVQGTATFRIVGPTPPLPQPTPPTTIPLPGGPIPPRPPDPPTDPPPPLVMISFTASDAPTAGAKVVFTAVVGTATGETPPPLYFVWDFDGDGIDDELTTGSPSSAAKFSFAAPGTYHATVVVTADDRRGAKQTITITVS